MLGELQSIYREKSEWKDKLKLAIDSTEDEAVVASPGIHDDGDDDQHNSSINELQMQIMGGHGDDDFERDDGGAPKEDLDLNNYKDIGEQELMRNHNSV